MKEETKRNLKKAELMYYKAKLIGMMYSGVSVTSLIMALKEMDKKEMNEIYFGGCSLIFLLSLLGNTICYGVNEEWEEYREIVYRKRKRK